MKKLTLLFFLSGFFSSSAQGPFKKIWDYRFGGTAEERLECFIKTPDGNFILGGTSKSEAGGDKTEPNKDTSAQNAGNRARDYWIVKVTGNGTKLWDKTIGGESEDQLNAVCAAKDGGYLLAGYSHSDVSGDKTNTNKGVTDYWVVKLDADGNKKWDKDFGVVNENNQLWNAIACSDGGFLLGGHTRGGGTGDKTEPSYGWDDYWVIKIDSAGNKEWDRGYGGSEPEAFFTMVESPYGGYLIGGHSLSNTSGNKSQDHFGNQDYWVLRIDTTGNIKWDLDFGGTDVDYLTTIENSVDGGFLLGGISVSNTSGNKTQDTKDTSSNFFQQGDYWIVKIDSSGNKVFDRDYGGFASDYEWTFTEDLSGNGYLLSGNTNSHAGGDKTENNTGTRQNWIVKTDSLGNVRWDKTILTSGEEWQGMVIQESEQCFYLASHSYSDSGGFKTQNSRGGSDFWLLKFCDSTYTKAIFEANSGVCSGSCIEFSNFSINTNTYQWNFPGGNPPSSTDASPTICYPNAGNYDVTLIASNSFESDTLLLTDYVTVYPYIPQSIIQSGDTLFSNQGSLSYQWYHDGLIISGATNYFLVLSDSGDYNVICSDSNGCEVEAVIFDVHIGVEELTKNENVYCFPNPSYGELVVTAISSPAIIELYNSQGKLAFTTRSVPHQQTRINCESFPPGVYLLKLYTNEKFITWKISIQD